MSEEQKAFTGAKAFLMIPPSIAEDKDLLKKPKSIILMGHIISMLNVTGSFFMSNKKIAERIDVNSRSVNRYLELLEEKKLISRENIKSSENGAIIGRKIRAGDDLMTYMSRGWRNECQGGTGTDVVPPMTPRSTKYNSNNRTTNRTVEDTYSSADAEPPIPYKEIIDYLNKKTNQHLRYQTKAYQKLIRQRFEEGATLEDFKKAIDNQAYAWQGTRFWKYMRPSTLFQASKFDSYVNANDLNQAKQPSNGGYGGEPNISDIPDDDLPF